MPSAGSRRPNNVTETPLGGLSIVKYAHVTKLASAKFGTFPIVVSCTGIPSNATASSRVRIWHGSAVRASNFGGAGVGVGAGAAHAAKLHNSAPMMKKIRTPIKLCPAYNSDKCNSCSFQKILSANKAIIISKPVFCKRHNPLGCNHIWDKFSSERQFVANKIRNNENAKMCSERIAFARTLVCKSRLCVIVAAISNRLL